ncbi:MAG TPA: tRNA (adenosine(37)-N6)-threonylcarbamoyltransferase complex dimerization subunit type 1 TsaB, partial [Povalibacter sp.]|nr:tRNA (adenosine(37)-N6)-threonylcarbamoyltransferase complex dimerization subunit type 1 TsaB [Povalibacter sp.]
MKILAIDTATERCSVALRLDGQVFERSVETPRGHADLVLPMVTELLNEAGIALASLDGIAYGRGPGGFTGVRIAIGVVQGLALGADLPTVGVSDLAAVAVQVATPEARVLVCMDARMNEVYWGEFVGDEAWGVTAIGIEHVGAASSVEPQRAPDLLAGTGFRAFPELAVRYPGRPLHHLLPLASSIALLGEPLLRQGQGVSAEQAQPVYLRDNVAVAKKP